MNSINIEKASLAGIRVLQAISRQTFYETFAGENSEENMQKYLDESFSLEKLKEEVSDSHSDFYFAVSAGRVIGYLKINYGAAQTEPNDGNALEIERIYVLGEFQGKGAGQALFEKALQTAAERGSAYIWLGVWEKNQRAISFYRKNGFVESGNHVFKLGNDLQTDILMRLTLGARATGP